MKSKKTGKPVFFVVFVLIVAFAYLAFFGMDNYYGDRRDIYFKGTEDIRWGIDIKGGVEAVFSPNKDENKITTEDMEAAKTLIEQRLTNQNITDYEVYTDNSNKQVIVRFPWEAGETDFDAIETVKKLGASAMLVFREGTEEDGKIVLQGAADVKEAIPAIDTSKGTNDPILSLEFTSSGKSKFAEATSRLVGKTISIWLSTTTTDLDENGDPIVENVLLQSATVQEAITEGKCTISSGSGSKMTTEYVKELANSINSGKLPFQMTADDSKIQIISPSLGENALKVMVIAGALAFALVCLLMILRYRLNGVVAAIALLGQLAGALACVSGFFSSFDSFTLTIPGIAGIILSIGMGVDCNVISAERIRDEFQKGKTIDGAIDSGYKNSFSAVFDGNITIIIVALVLMAAFGSPDSILTKIFSFFMPFLGTSITGSIYSFGYTLLVGVIFNFIMGMTASKLMTKSLSGFKFLRKPWLYGGEKNAQ